MQNAKLNQVLAIEKGVKERAHKLLTDLYQQAQKAVLFNGFFKKYRKINEQSETYPDQVQRVQVKAEDSLTAALAAKVELANVTATKDYANCNAKADIVVDDEVIVADAPATFILWLEKQVEDLRTFITQLPTLDEAEDWTLDGNVGIYKSGEIATHRTAKVQEPIVLFPATPEHPAQTQLIVKDVLVGYWDETKMSGALPHPRKSALLSRVEKLHKAIKVAREAANMVDAPRQEAGTALYSYLQS